ncbi:MAG: leucyl aminopeptidase [bacterium]|nr:leucyl aminopeptidase [bacterium]
MKISVVKEVPKRASNLTYVVLLPKDEGFAPFDLRDSWANRALQKEGFTSAFGEISILTSVEEDAPRYICVGVGSKANITPMYLKRLVGIIARSLQKKGIDEYILSLPLWLSHDAFNTIRLTVQTLLVSTYTFDKYITDETRKKNVPKSVKVISLFEISSADTARALKEGQVLGMMTNNARQLGNTPPMDMTPLALSSYARTLAKKYKKISVKILGPKELKAQKMGGILAVSAGSSEDAQFIVLEYRGDKKNAPPIVLVGKAVTFDAGGLSIKPSAKLDEMKFDMLGGATVLAAIETIAELQLKRNVVVLVAATENVLGPSAYRPGDIITSHSGKTIEVLNTDAEGRILLADGLSYAKKFKPLVVLDVATLTGACVSALGANYAGLFTRSNNIAGELLEIGEQSGDYFWRLPLDDDFKKSMQSEIADTRNISLSRDGDASCAAGFLEYFIDYPWAHIDIAGSAWNTEKSYLGAGATGSHVDALVRFVERYNA